jgi:hypothetical protein
MRASHLGHEGHVGESNSLAGVVGVEVVRSEKFLDGYLWFFRFELSANANTAAAVVACITGNRTLAFSDRGYSSLVPASIRAMRDAEVFLVKACRSHSSSSWAEVSREELAAYLALCIRFHDPESEEPFHIFDFPGRAHLGRINRTAWASFRNVMSIRLGRPTYLQERLQPYGLGALGAWLAGVWRYFA